MFNTYKGRTLVQMKIHANQQALEINRLRAALQLARLHIKDTLLEGAIISLENPGVGLGGYLDAVIAEAE
jgi:hypothetical protein